MGLAAWCGRCGASFPLVEVVADPATVGRCPRCHELFGESYAVVVVQAVRRLLAAEQELRGALSELSATAPSLHIELRT